MHFFPVFGGQEVYIETMNKFLEENGLEISVLQPSRSFSEEKPVFVHYVPQLRFFHRFNRDLEWFWFNFLILFKKKFLKTQDILISHYPFHYPSLSWHSNVVVVSHGVDWPDNPISLLDRYKLFCAKKIFSDKIKIVSNDSNFIRQIGIDVQPGNNLFQEVHENIWFIPNCIDTKKYFPTFASRENIIFVPRNIRKSRGIHLAIEAFNLFNHLHQNFRLIIAGGPLDGEYFDYCVSLTRMYSLENSIDFLGNIKNDRLIVFYNISMITLIPTVAFEGTSLSALESMACQTPVVSTRVGGLSDLPTHKVDLSPHDICEGLNFVYENWDFESTRQYKETIGVFNLSNWETAWMKVVNAGPKKG
jgi:glycosyltransferase involved in cell wall biosynthesis